LKTTEGFVIAGSAGQGCPPLLLGEANAWDRNIFVVLKLSVYAEAPPSAVGSSPSQFQLSDGAQVGLPFLFWHN